MADLTSGHAGHDPLLVAGLLDADLAETDRAAAQVRVAACPDCAGVYADLLALSVATRSQPVPVRQRDFRLTAADAARLSAEPGDARPRLTGVMTDLPVTSAHRSHDTTLVASLADHSLPPLERSAAEALVAACTECADLHADLMTLVAATRAMPTPPRPIAYTLTPAHAARLRPNPWRRLVAAVGSSRDGVTRPLAIGLSTLGLVGLLVTSAPSVLQGGFGSSAASSPAGGAESITSAPGGATDVSSEPDRAAGAALAPAAGGEGTVAASGAPERAAPSVAPVYGVTNAGPIPAASAGQQADGSGKGALSATAEPSAPSLETTAAATVAAPPSGIDPMLIISTALLLVGLGLFVLRWTARRLSEG